MKALQKKLKRCNKVQKFFYFLITFLYVVGFAFFTLNILKLKGIETGIRITLITFFIIWGLIYALSGLVTMVAKKKKSFITLTIFNVIFITAFFFSGVIINFVISSLNKMNKEYIVYTTNLIALNETELNSKSKIGMISNVDDIEGHILANKLIDKEDLDYEIVEYDEEKKMLYALYQKEIDGLFISGNYEIKYQDDDIFGNLGKDVKVLYEYSEKMKNQDYIKSDKKLTEPFTLLIMGVDSRFEGMDANQAFNGDTLILITFNPNTLTATMVNIPRDMYVPIACRNDAYDKINSSAASGAKCVIDTIENITDIDIDYYVKINFKGVVDLVDALGGITVDVEPPHFDTYGGRVCEQDSDRRQGEDLICMDTGIQTLNGEQALAYSRCRHLYILSDIDRNRHQQDVIEAIAQSFKNINSINKVKKIIDTVSNNADSNMTAEQMLSFYEVCKQMLSNANMSDDSLITIKKGFLEYYSLPVYLPHYNATTSALGYYQSSMDAIIKMMKVNLELEEPDMIKSYSIDYNEDYKTEPIGKNIRDNNVLETFPSFIGQTEAEARSWCSQRGISVSTETISAGGIKGTIANQSVHQGTFVKNVNKVTLYISNGKGSNITSNDIIVDNEE